MKYGEGGIEELFQSVALLIAGSDQLEAGSEEIEDKRLQRLP